MNFKINKNKGGKIMKKQTKNSKKKTLKQQIKEIESSFEKIDKNILSKILDLKISIKGFMSQKKKLIKKLEDKLKKQNDNKDDLFLLNISYPIGLR